MQLEPESLKRDALFSADPVAQSEDGCVKAIYPGSGNGDPEAVPGVCPKTKGVASAGPLTLEVDGEVFALSPNAFGGTDYAWLSGPNPGYGFGASPTRNLSLDEHLENIRGFLAQIDPATGYIQDDTSHRAV